MTYYFADISDIWGHSVVLGGASTLSGAQKICARHCKRNYKCELSLWSGIGPWYASPVLNGIDRTYRIYTSDVSSRVVSPA